MTKRISVFGGSSPEPGSKAYQAAYELGKYLGQAGLTVLTGGYMGTMEAASRGANEAGGHVIGVTCEEIESFRPVGPNPWVQEEWRRKTLRDRLSALLDNCDAAIALPGGVGTLLEINLCWNEFAIHAQDPKPLILIGSGWRTVMETFFKELGEYVHIKAREYIAFAPDPSGAFELLGQFLDFNQTEDR
jgi:uncharacterized protein (TIGR00730 family)